MRLGRTLGRFLRPPTLVWSDRSISRSHLVGPEHREAFRRFGCKTGRAFFPHRVRFIPKAVPDAGFRARKVTRVRGPESFWTTTLHADSPVLEEFPPQLFFDDDLIWHRQHLGVPGHVACGSAVLLGDDLIVLEFFSDIVQRSSRIREQRNRLARRFSGWPNLIVHAMAHLAVRLGAKRIRSPKADLIFSLTDPARDTERPLFDRAYDRTLSNGFGATSEGDWWRIEVARLAPYLAPLGEVEEPVHRDDRPTVCLLHDIERGMGHHSSEPEFAQKVERWGWRNLDRILDAEARAGVTGTYSVVARLLPEVQGRIETAGHDLAFHSFDHGDGPQLARCREVDYRVRGYRPPQSRLLDEHNEWSLMRWNLEWLASSSHSLGVDEPELSKRIVKVPVALDDYPLHTGAMTYEAWERELWSTVETQRFTVVGLHDCYGDHWLDHYPRLLERLSEVARPARIGDVADELFLAAAI